VRKIAIALGITVSLAAILAVTVGSASATRTTPRFVSTSGAAVSACTPLREIDIRYVAPSGVESASPIAGSATLHVFADGSGTVTQIEPPAGWSPMTASAAELEAYGFPPRPADPEGAVQCEFTQLVRYRR
jgi:hypothetical protein